MRLLQRDYYRICQREVYYQRGRKKRLTTACYECSTSPEFRTKLELVTADQIGEVNLTIWQVVKETGNPIRFIDAVNIACDRNPNVREYFGEGELTEEDRRLWPFIYEIVSRPTDNS